MPAGARGDPAAERRELEALRKVPQGEPVRLELGLQRRPEGAPLDAGGAGGAVDLDHAMHVAQVQCHGRLVAAQPVDAGLDPADHARAAAERRDRRLRRLRPVEHGRPAHVVRIGFSVGMRGPVVALGRGDRGQRSRRLHARGMQLDFVEPRRLDLGEFVDPEPLLDPRPDESLLLRGDALAFATPAEMFEPRLCHFLLPPIFQTSIRHPEVLAHSHDKPHAPKFVARASKDARPPALGLSPFEARARTTPNAVRLRVREHLR